MRPNLDILLRLYALVSDSLPAQEAVARALAKDLPVSNADADELARFVFQARELLAPRTDVIRPSRGWVVAADFNGEG